MTAQVLIKAQVLICNYIIRHGRSEFVDIFLVEGVVWCLPSLWTTPLGESNIMDTDDCLHILYLLTFLNLVIVIRTGPEKWRRVH